MRARLVVGILAISLLGVLPPGAAAAQEPEGEPVVVAGGSAAVAEGVVAEVAAVTGRPVERLAGGDRYATAAAIAAEFAVGSPVFVAWAGGFADALAGAPAAAVAGGPILLVDTDGMPEATRAALERVQPASITILGGTAVVSAAVAAELAGFTTGEVARLAGPDRYGTAAAIAGTFTAPVDVVYVASGVGFADALAGAQAAGLQGVPVVLTEPDGLPAATAEALDVLAPGRIVVLGGPAAVAEGVVTELGAFTDGTVERLAGLTRFETAVAVVEATYPEGATTAFLASGADFPDALAIAPLAAGAAAGGGFAGAGARPDGPLLLVDDPLPEVVRALLEQLFGGGVLPPAENGTPTVADVEATTRPGVPVEVTLEGSDPDGDALTFAVASDPAGGTVAIDGDVATYTPAPGTRGEDTFTYTASDGEMTSEPGTVTIMVRSPASDDDPPVVNLDPGGPADPDVVSGVFTEDGGPVLLAPAATVDDPDGTTLESVTATLAAVPDGADELLAVDTTGTTLQAVFLAGVMTVTPTAPDVEAPEAEFQAVLRTLAYDNADQDPDTGDRTITVVASDGADSDPVTATLPVAATDDAPAAVDDADTVAEDDPATAIDVLANDTDLDAGPIAIGSVTQPADGTVAITNAGADLTYEPDADHCNDPPSTALDTFTYTLTPGGSTATVTVTVTCDDDPPVAVDDAATVTEDDPATTIDVLGNDTDIDTGSKSVAAVTQPASGTVVITNAGADLTYEPNADSCNTPPGTSLDTFTYTLAPGGSTATVSVTVTCVDDAPVAVDDAATVSEDDPATTFDVLANDTDVDGGPISIASVTQPADGTVVITNAGADLTYEPDPDFCTLGLSTDTFTYTLAPGADIATVSMTVSCVDDAPVADDDSPSVDEDASASAVDVLANDDDVDGGPISIASVTQPVNGTVVITGGGTGLSYAPAANYCNTSAGPTDDFTYTLTPGGSTATVHVTVTCVDDPPSAAADAATVNEDSGANAIDVLANDPDADGGVQEVQSVTQPSNGTVVITGGGTGVSYTPNANSCNSVAGVPDTFTYTLNGGSSATVSVTVTCVDDPPVAVADAATVTEDSGANAVPVLANDTDVDDGPISVASVTQPAGGAVAITGGGTGVSYTPDGNYCNNPPGTTLDTFTYTLTPGGSSTTVTVTVTCVDDNPVAVADAATVVEDSGANAVDVLANDTDVDAGPISVASVTQPAGGAVAITGGGTGVSYTPNANSCNSVAGVPDTFTYTLSPGGSSTTVSITVTCVDDPPVAVADAASVNEDSGANAVDVLGNDTDIDAGPISVTSVTQPANGTVAITGGGTGVSYAPNANYCNNPPGTTLDTFTYTLSPGGSSTTVTITVTCVNDPPVGVADTFDALANTRLAVSTATSDPKVAVTGNVLANDTDVDSPNGGFTAVAGALSSTGCPGCDNVTMAADGTFTYDPPPGVTTTDSFTYTLSDNDTDEGPAQTGTGTVNIDLVGPVIWYVDEDVVAAGSGTSHDPFGALTSLQSAGGVGDSDGPGDIIFLYTATAPSTGGLPLEANQRLLGEPFGLTVDPVGSLPSQLLLAANAGLANPVITNGAGPGITLANGVELQRVSADNATGAVDVAVGILGTNVDTATIGAGVTASSNAGGGIRLIGGNGTITSAATIASNTGHPLYIQNRTGGTVTISGTMASTSRGVTLDNNDNATINITGTMTLGNTGANAGFVATNGGTVTATGAGNTLAATTGTLINIADTTIGAAGVTFTNVQSSGAANGILLSNAGAGPLTVSGGSIGSITTRGVDVNAGSGNVTYNGTITTSGAAARSVEVTSRTGGTVDFNGLVTDTSTGINLVGNNAGLIRFDGGITASTGANTAFNATVSGNVAVTDTNGTTAPNNTLTTTTGTALNVQNTTIHTDDLTFQSIAANGAASGIVLTSTGSSGNLIVSGDGDGNPDGGGGTIQNTTFHGIQLTSTMSPSLTDISVVNAGNGDNEHGMLLTDVSGTVTLDDIAINGAAEELILLDNNVSVTMNVTGSTFTHGAVVGGFAGNGIRIQPDVANATVSITGSTFTDVKGNSVQIGASQLNSTGSSSLTFTGNTVNVTQAGRASGVAVSGQELTSTNLTIGGAGALGNTFNGAGGNGVISIDVNDASTVTGSIVNNTITNPPGIGIFSAVDEAATSTLTFASNTVTNSGGDGIQLVNFGGVGTSTMNATITNNAVNGHSLSTAVSFVGGISVTSFEEIMDLQLTGNTVTGTPASAAQCGGAPCVDYYLEEVGGTFRLEEIPNTDDTTATAAYVNSINDAGPVTIFGIIDLSNGTPITNG